MTTSMRQHPLDTVHHPPGFIEPCLPTVSRAVPTGPQWAYEIKHDGFRFICHLSLGRCRDWIKLKNRAHPAIERAMLIALSRRGGSRSR
jgi:ATP-dependent DNA ligase